MSTEEFAATPVLEHRLVRLVPLEPAHEQELIAAASIGELWKTWYLRHVPAPDAMGKEIARLLDQQQQGKQAPYAVTDPASGKALGVTTFMNLDATNKRLEIGSTWLGREAQGTGINLAMKYLMLQRAFEVLDCNAVELRTHWHNHQSRAAIAKLGAKQDGVLRNHILFPDGHIRDTVVFSILNTEWPSVRNGLNHRLEA
ncbi:GNAT family N-acetyltransferase [Nesterenkonia sp. MY13]|uniref:GNAT family N-acetyltransferase n=1 Tax=Nesterenkonia sedimenti TaxID=1463632 RepID=A0A7X8TJP3_9MICC|nr:GNAT family protein [Nesterenkonia sedimenti]NLS09765.1 GNAT family N-acetyltransferase [Nesterenkonia sedimenti]